MISRVSFYLSLFDLKLFQVRVKGPYNCDSGVTHSVWCRCSDHTDTVIVSQAHGAATLVPTAEQVLVPLVTGVNSVRSALV